MCNDFLPIFYKKKKDLKQVSDKCKLEFNFQTYSTQCD